MISPTFSIRTGGMFQDANVAGRNYVTDDRWGGFISTKWTPTNDIKITTNYVHTDLSGLPDFGVPYYKQGNGPVTEFGIPRQNWYGFVNRDFQTARQDFGTLTGEYKVTDSITLTSRTRAEHSLLAYIGTLPNATVRRQIPIRRHGRSPRARRAATSGSISWRTRKRPRSSSTPGRSSIRRRWGWKSPTSASGSTAIPGFHRKLLAATPPGNGSLQDQSIYAPNYTFFPFGIPSLVGNPIRYNVDSKALYVMDTANWQDTIILNGGVRYDGYDLRSSEQHAIEPRSTRISSITTSASSSSRCRSEASMPPTRRRPIRSAPNSTPQARDYGGVAPGSHPILGPERNKAAEIGTKWELFDRHLLVTGALFHTEKDNARETVNVNGTNMLQSGAAYQVEGIDLEVSGKITDRWSVFGGLVLMRSKVTQSAIPRQHRAADGQHRP